MRRSSLSLVATWAVAVAALAALACGAPDRTAERPIPAGPHRVRATPDAARALAARGATVLGDYGAFVVLDAPAGALASADEPGVELRDDDLRVLLDSGPLDTTTPAARALATAPADPSPRALHLVQFSGPIRPEWRAALDALGLRVVGYVPSDAYLVSGPAAALNALAQALPPRALQFRAPYAPELKLEAALARRDPGAYAVQLVEDPAENPATLALAAALARTPPRIDRALGFVNVIVDAGGAGLAAAQELAARPDVVSIHAYFEPALRDERQDVLLAGASARGAPQGPGWLEWLTAKGFTQAQFDASGFGVDVTDSGVDNGTDQPDHFGLYRQGDPAGASRVAYVRLEGTAHTSSRIQGCDGHGTINAHIVGGWSSGANGSGFPFADAEGYRYGLGVAPFVRLGSSVVFDPYAFTNPDYEDLQSRAYAAGMRVSSNSWGDEGTGYDAQAQRYDALVRDAQPDGAAVAVAGNQEMVIVFAAGNAGPDATTVGSPATAKNVITVGAAEGVQAFGVADGCGVADGSADSALDVASFSSRGPTADGRTRPDLLAPGTHVSGGAPQAPGQRGPPPAAPLGKALSCFTGLEVCGGPTTSFFPDGQQWYTASSGTSHAAPAVAGAAALLRQWFLNHGLRAPSPAMTKAYLVHAARYMTGAGAADALFSPSQGMGLLDLGTAFDGAPRLLRDQEPGDLLTHSGETRTFTGWIADPTRPLRVTLAFTDAPGPTFGAAWVNDLDLAVDVGGTRYKGNVFSGGTSIPGGSADARNNLESVFLAPGPNGAVTVTITAANLAGDGVPGNGAPLDQDFALVASNWCTSAPPSRPASASAAPAGDNAVSVSWTPVAGATRYQIYRGPSVGGPFELVATVAAPPWLDTDRSGGTTFHYEIRAGGACSFSDPVSASATATGACLLPPAFAGLASAVSARTLTCADALSWEPASPSCGGAIRYEIFRGAPGFTPAPANRIATATGTSFTDAGGLASGTAYAYVVRAVEELAGRGAISDANAVEQIARPFFGGGFEDDLDGNRPGAPDEWWSAQASSGSAAAPFRPVSGCHFQSASTAWRFGAASSACGGTYPPSFDGRLVLGGADGLSVVATGTTLSFRLYYNLERGFDGAWLEYSTTGPEGPFRPVPDSAPAASGIPYFTAGSYDAALYGLGQRAWTGYSPAAPDGLRAVTVKLDGLLDRNVWFAWTVHTNATLQYEGLYLDDVVVDGPAIACSTTPVAPGPPIRYRLSGLPASLRAGDVATLLVQAIDRNGQVSSDYAGTAAVSSSDPRAVVAPSVAFTHGEASVPLQLRSVGAQTITFTDAAAGLSVAGAATVSPGAPAALRLDFGATAVTAGATLAPAPTATVVDGCGNPVSSSVGVALSLAGGPAGAALAGTTSIQAADGLAVFPAVRVERAGTGYRLVASAPGFPAAESGAFAVLPAPPARLEIVEQPQAARAGEPFSPALRIRAVDAYGNPSGERLPVRLSVATGPGALDGGDTAQGDPTVATFAASSLDLAGTYTLTAASDGLAPATTAAIAVRAGAPSTAEILAQPAAAQAGLPLTPAVRVQLRDRFGNACDDAAGADVHLAIASAPSGGALLGVATAAPAAGLASFARVALDRPGAYTLQLWAGETPLGALSSIEVAAGPVKALRVDGPRQAKLGEAVSYAVVPVDGAGQPVPGWLGRLEVAATDPAAELPAAAIAVEGGASAPVGIAFHTAGPQDLTVRDVADPAVAATVRVQVAPAAGGGAGGGGGCGGGSAGPGSLLGAGLALAALARRRRAAMLTRSR